MALNFKQFKDYSSFFKPKDLLYPSKLPSIFLVVDFPVLHISFCLTFFPHFCTVIYSLYCDGLLFFLRKIPIQCFAAWLGALCLCVSFLTAPLIVAVCRRKSTRLAALFGGLITALACLFTSFAVQFHQVLLSYGLVLGLGAGIVRETSGLMLGHYFKRRREFVEMVAQAGAGVGIALFSVLYKEAVG